MPSAAFLAATIRGIDIICQVGKNFNPEAADFNLEAVFSLGLHNLAEFIGELSTNANKELGIEQASTNMLRTKLCLSRAVQGGPA